MTTPSRKPRITPSRIQIEVVDSQRSLAIEPGWVEDRVTRSLQSLGITAAELSIALVDDATIRPINAQHLGHDWPTDVITFDLGGDPDANLVGEIVISAEMAGKQANLRHVDPLDELTLYLVHGLLHLHGYDDRIDEDVAVMRRREGEVLEALGLVNPFPQTEVIRSRSAQPGQETLI